MKKLVLLLCLIFITSFVYAGDKPIRVSDEGYEKIIGKRYEIVSPIIYLSLKNHLLIEHLLLFGQKI
jgi:hypothetical protein